VSEVGVKARVMVMVNFVVMAAVPSTQLRTRQEVCCVTVH